MKPIRMFLSGALAGVATLAASTPVRADTPLPDPVATRVIAGTDVTVDTVLGSAGSIATAESAAAFDVVQIRSASGDTAHGVRIRLERSRRTDSIYLDEAEFAQLRTELRGVGAWLDNDPGCSSRSYCVHGIARCRPTQDLRPALCPAVYFETDGDEQGVLLTTPVNSYRFPAVPIGDWIAAIDTALGILADRHASMDTD